jgi:heme-degrading monooxygenase HmoA
MQKVLIDRFIVPEENKTAFLDAVRESARFIRTVPGFIEGFVYEKTDGASPQNVVTTAVWESAEAYESARQVVLAEFQRRGFNPPEIMARLNIQMDRSVYHRTSY